MDINNAQPADEEQVVAKPSITKKKVWVGTYILLALGFIAVYFLLQQNVFGIIDSYKPLLRKVALGGFFSMLILAIAKFTEGVVVRRSKTRSAQYNLTRVVRLAAVLLICLVIVSSLFTNWYTAAVSLGLISLIVGFALQTPITSFIGWINILIRTPYHVGDRIQIAEFKGDVVEINYFDTTLWEFSGDYLTNDVPSGRLIRFPNSLVLQEPVFNYSWKKFPYIWNEIPFHVAYESDLTYVSDVIKQVATKELGPEAEQNIRLFKELVKQTPVDELEIKEYPYVSFRINANTWVEVMLVYLVAPKQASTVRTRLIKNIIAELLKEPQKVMFPNSNNR